MLKKFEKKNDSKSWAELQYVAITGQVSEPASYY